MGEEGSGHPTNEDLLLLVQALGLGTNANPGLPAACRPTWGPRDSQKWKGPHFLCHPLSSANSANLEAGCTSWLGAWVPLTHMQAPRKPLVPTCLAPQIVISRVPAPGSREGRRVSYGRFGSKVGAYGRGKGRTCQKR